MPRISHTLFTLLRQNYANQKKTRIFCGGYDSDDDDNNT